MKRERGKKIYFFFFEKKGFVKERKGERERFQGLTLLNKQKEFIQKKREEERKERNHWRNYTTIGMKFFTFFTSNRKKTNTLYWRRRYVVCKDKTV